MNSSESGCPQCVRMRKPGGVWEELATERGKELFREKLFKG